MRDSRIKKALTVAAVVSAIGICGCRGKPIFHQPGTDIEHIYSKIYLTDYNTAWQATLDAFKSFEKTVQNRQGGVLQTAWIENTAEKNFIDSFGGDATYVKAKYRLYVSVAPGSYSGKSSVKISVRKDQLIQRDLLEGWRQVSSDSIEEKTILYRVGRLIFIKLKLEEIERRKMQQVLQQGV